MTRATLLLPLLLAACVVSPPSPERIESMSRPELVRELERVRGAASLSMADYRPHVAALRAAVADKTPEWDERTREAVRGGFVILGMTGAQVRISWGPPHDINSTVGSWGRHEQWVYSRGLHKRQYVYLRGGVVTSWQNY